MSETTNEMDEREQAVTVFRLKLEGRDPMHETALLVALREEGYSAHSVSGGIEVITVELSTAEAPRAAIARIVDWMDANPDAALNVSLISRGVDVRDERFTPI